jgi:hypothetical protein
MSLSKWLLYLRMYRMVNDKLLYIHKVYFYMSNSTYCDGKVWPGSGYAWIHIGLAPWIRIRLRIRIEVKSWIRIRNKTNAEPKHC